MTEFTYSKICVTLDLLKALLLKLHAETGLIEYATMHLEVCALKDKIVRMY